MKTISEPAGVGCSTAGGLLAIVLWSATFALARSLTEQVGALAAGAAVYLFGGVLGLLRLGWPAASLRRWGRLPRLYVWGCGTLFVLYTTLIYAAVDLARDRTQLLEIALVNYLWPAATVLLSVPLLGQRAGALLWPGTVIAVAGIVLVMTPEEAVSWSCFWGNLRGNPAAYVLAFLAALGWALYSNLVRRWSEPGGAGAVELFVAVTGLVLLLLDWAAPGPVVWTRRVLVESALLGVMTVLAYGLWDRAMRRGNLLLVVSCSYLTPFLSTLVSCLYLRVMPGTQLWTGCGLIVAGSLLTWRSVGARGGGPR